MTIKDLIDKLVMYPQDMEVVYNYDTGHSYPTFKSVYYLREDSGPYKVCLDKDIKDKPPNGGSKN